MMRPCLVCGEPSDGTRCAEHRQPDHKPSARKRGYDGQWDRLSKRARRAQPFCTDCGATEDLQADHLPSAWERKAARLPIRLADVDVCCGPCNRARGAARGLTTRGETPPLGVSDPAPEARWALHTGRRRVC